jgi:hypothetical protein
MGKKAEDKQQTNQGQREVQDTARCAAGFKRHCISPFLIRCALSGLPRRWQPGAPLQKSRAALARPLLTQGFGCLKPPCASGPKRLRPLAAAQMPQASKSSAKLRVDLRFGGAVIVEAFHAWQETIRARDLGNSSVVEFSQDTHQRAG